MRLHLVGGFLGSGKTTAIAAAARGLMEQGKRVGIVTNDQGKYLVDTLFFRTLHAPTVEVTGGCFCCHYDDLAERLCELEQSAQPDVIFAESVGSCADLVATVVKPLLAFAQASVTPASFSVFADARLLAQRLAGAALPFSENVVYLFDEQLAEAGLIVINKIDLLPAAALEELWARAHDGYPQTPLLLQNSLAPQGVMPWLEMLESGSVPPPGQSLQIDYARYGAAERDLAWLDAELAVTAGPDGLRATVAALVEAIVAAVQSAGWPVGHIKFLVQTQGVAVKLSAAAGDGPGWAAQLPALPGAQATVAVNGRVAATPAALEDRVRAVLAGPELASRAEVATLTGFLPGWPNPTHRLP